MALEKTRDILNDSYNNKYGVAAFNVFNYESIKWTLDVAEMENTPIIIQFYPTMSSYIALSTITTITKELSKNMKVPVGLHLDHSPTFEIAMEGIKAGFLSVMIDGSTLPFEANAAVTKKVVEIAKIFGVDVEAELGLVGRAENKEDFMDSEKYTSVKEAIDFLERTRVNSLAVSIGNSHGHYVCNPNLDVVRLSEINDALRIPLVLHGGSGIPVCQVQEAIRHGIAKVNIATELGVEFQKSVKDNLETSLALKLAILGTMMGAETQIKEYIRQKIRILNPEGYRF